MIEIHDYIIKIMPLLIPILITLVGWVIYQRQLKSNKKDLLRTNIFSCLFDLNVYMKYLIFRVERWEEDSEKGLEILKFDGIKFVDKDKDSARRKVLFYVYSEYFIKIKNEYLKNIYPILYLAEKGKKIDLFFDDLFERCNRSYDDAIKTNLVMGISSDIFDIWGKDKNYEYCKNIFNKIEKCI